MTTLTIFVKTMLIMSPGNHNQEPLRVNNEEIEAMKRAEDEKYGGMKRGPHNQPKKKKRK